MKRFQNRTRGGVHVHLLISDFIFLNKHSNVTLIVMVSLGGFMF